VKLENVAPFTQLKSGVFSTRVGGTAPGPLAPGESYEFSFTAGKGQKLAFATMLGQSNDWIFAPAPGGIELYENGNPISGDVTSQVYLWDVGTEQDEEPGVGSHTGPNQASATDGAIDPNRNVRRVTSPTTLSTGASFNVPSVPSMMRVTVSSDAATRRFTVRIMNVASDTSTLQTSQGAKPVRFSPGVWTLTTGGEPLFSEGQVDRAFGLENIAESGNVTALASMLANTTGVGTPISPGVYVVNQGQATLFKTGEADRGQGLERIAEEGNIMPLVDSLKGQTDVVSGLFNTPEGATSPGAAGPGSAYTFEFTARPGDRLSLATMFGMSNDWIFATMPDGIALFDDEGNAVMGDFSSNLRIYDVGTELSEELGVGPNVGPQQAAPNTGLADTDNKVREVTSAEYGTSAAAHLKLTITH
jgi:hypothetical protein